jgi:hypothetical protein
VKEIEKLTLSSDNRYLLTLFKLLVSGLFDLSLTVLLKFPFNVCAAVGWQWNRGWDELLLREVTFFRVET